jgi:poly-gamma-glutamate synthesis protein (capsule biosynthesis protein)
VAGHSAHVFHGVAPGLIYDLGDFIDDYAVDAELRNDLGLLFLVSVEAGQLTTMEAVPIALDFCHTRLADAAEARWITQRFRRACGAFGADVEWHRGRLAVTWEGKPE